MSLENLNLVELNAQEVEMTEGGFRWEDYRRSYNVVDQRPGAGSEFSQTMSTFWHNLWN